MQMKKASVGHDSTVGARPACVHVPVVAACVRRSIVACRPLCVHNPTVSHLLACACGDVCPFGMTLNVVAAHWDVCVCLRHSGWLAWWWHGVIGCYWHGGDS